MSRCIQIYNSVLTDQYLFHCSEQCRAASPEGNGTSEGNNGEGAEGSVNSWPVVSERKAVDLLVASSALTDGLACA